MMIAATADIHSPKYLSLFIKSLKEIRGKPDVFILAGDVVYKNKIEMLKPVIESIHRVLGDIKIIGVFGNEEYRDYEEEYIQKYPEITWLDDSYVVLEINGLKTGFVGTRGALDKPTAWQIKNMPGIQEYYDSLPGKIEEIASILRQRVDKIVFISHYGVTYKNLRGEPRHVWPHLASSKFEKIIMKGLFDLVIHGHAHNAVIDKIVIRKTPVYNVSLPARKKIVMIELTKYQGLERWIFRQ